MKPEVLGWRPGLEGLRGVAVLAVMLYHFEATKEWFPGGSLGVDLFFILSGFLITTLLLEEKSRDGKISLVGFYQRRARRLLPALVLFLAIFSAITIVAQQPGMDRLPATVVTSQLYVFNWLDDFGGAATPGSGHLWSLSVEEQFYLVWPIVLIVVLWFRPSLLLWVSLAVFVLAASLPFWSGRGSGELYSGTDFRAQELMAGAILAQLRFAGVVAPSIVNRIQFRAALLFSVMFFLFFVLELHDRKAFLYSGMYTAVGVLGAVIVCAALYAPPRILTSRAIRYIGTRSYALYLWHHVINYWLLDLDAIPGLILSVCLSFAAAEISWRLVERNGSYLFRLFGIVGERFTTPAPEPAGVRPVTRVQPRPRAAE